MKGQEIRIFWGTIEQFLVRFFKFLGTYQVWVGYFPKKSTADFPTGNDVQIFLIFSQVGFGQELSM